jgi:hypothetical protein
MIDGSDLSYLPVAVTDHGHQGKCMVSTLAYLAGFKFGHDTCANRARDAFIGRCAQVFSVGAMRCVSEA